MGTSETAITQFEFREDGIVVARPVNLEIARTRQTVGASFDALSETLAGERRPLLWVPAAARRYPPEAWQVFVSRIGDVATALAILLVGRSDAPLGSFPDIINTLLVPVDKFSGEAEAIRWLQQYVGG